MKIISTLIFFFATPVSAELASSMTAVIVKTTPDGIEKYFPATRTKPGEMVEYRIVHVNSFDKALDGVTILGPIPQEMELVSAAHSIDIPAIFEVQGDFDPDQPGQEWSPLPVNKIVVAPDGTRSMRPAVRADFTAVRWRLSAPLPTRATVRHAYRTRVK